MRCGISPGTAREKIRVANALFDLPLTSGAFQSGRLSYSKARALTRAAMPHNEQSLLDYAIPATALQVEEHCRQLRNVQRDLSSVDAKRLQRQRYLSRSYHGDGSMTISVELPRESGELVMKALDMAMTQLEAEMLEEVPEESEESLLARDKCCRFPGCTHEKWLDAHHVMHWADGGETSLDNTVLLCSKHHRLLHEGEFEIERDCNGEWRFKRTAPVAKLPTG